MIAAVVALALAAVSIASVAVWLAIARGDEKAGRVAAEALVDKHVAEADRLADALKESDAENKRLRAELDLADRPVPAGSGRASLQAGIAESRARAASEAGPDADRPPVVSVDAPALAAAAGGPLARGSLPGGRR